MKRNLEEYDRLIKILEEYERCKLIENNHKEHWLKQSLFDLYTHFMKEVVEYFEEIIKDDIDIESALYELADIGNLKNMMADKLMQLQKDNEALDRLLEDIKAVDLQKHKEIS